LENFTGLKTDLDIVKMKGQNNFYRLRTKRFGRWKSCRTRNWWKTCGFPCEKLNREKLWRRWVSVGFASRSASSQL